MGFQFQLIYRVAKLGNRKESFVHDIGYETDMVIFFFWHLSFQHRHDLETKNRQPLTVSIDD